MVGEEVFGREGSFLLEEVSQRRWLVRIAEGEAGKIGDAVGGAQGGSPQWEGEGH